MLKYAVAMDIDDIIITVVPTTSQFDGRFDTRAQAKEFLDELQAAKQWDPPLFIKTFGDSKDD